MASTFHWLWHEGSVLIKLIGLLLLLMSIASWYWLARHAWQLWYLRRTARAMERFWQGGCFDEGLDRLAATGGGVANPYHRLALASQQLVQHHRRHPVADPAAPAWSERLADGMSAAIDEALEPLQRGLSLLASVGSTAPFIGLLGTVWGIYHAMGQIGQSGAHSIAQLAGPVGETLLMTALGLAVAIPAVLGYNALTRLNRRVHARLQRFARQLHEHFLTGAVPLVPGLNSGGGYGTKVR